MNNLSNEKLLAVVTGGAGGIGLAVAKRLQDRGYRIMIVEREQSVADAACVELDEDSIAHACDMADSTQVRDLGDALAGKWRDSIAVLVCNAGVISPGEVVETNEQAVDLQLDVNLRSVIQLVRSVLPILVEHNRGHILASISIGGICPMPSSSVYSASKAGLRAFFAAIYAELKHTNVHISGIYPSAVDTPMLFEEAMHGGSPLNFVGEIQTIDDVVNAYERAFDKHKLELYVPYMDSISTRIVSAFPTLLPKIYPFLNYLGEKGKKRYLENLDNRFIKPAFKRS